MTTTSPLNNLGAGVESMSKNKTIFDVQFKKINLCNHHKYIMTDGPNKLQAYQIIIKLTNIAKEKLKKKSSQFHISTSQFQLKI